MYEENTHTNTHTNVWKKQSYKCMKKIYSYTGQPITAPREHGVPCSRVPQPWQGGELPHLQLSAQQSFCWAVSGDWTANPLVTGLPHSPLRHGQPKHKCKNVWKRHAYKYMTKTRLQNRIQMYDKNAYKIAYKCMTKTRIQTRIQMYEKKHAYKCMTKTRIQTRIQMYEKEHSYKCMKKTRIQNRIQMYEENTHTNVWQKHAYKHAYKCMKKTVIQMYEKNILIYWRDGQPRAPQPWQGGELPHLQLSAQQSFF